MEEKKQLDWRKAVEYGQELKKRFKLNVNHINIWYVLVSKQYKEEPAPTIEEVYWFFSKHDKLRTIKACITQLVNKGFIQVSDNRLILVNHNCF